MALYKKEIVVRPNSTATEAQAIAATRDFVNSFQNASGNANGSGGFIDFFFGDCFDSRNGNIYRIFSDACAGEYSMPHENGLIKYDVLNNATNATKEYVTDAIDAIDLGAGGTTDLTAINDTLTDHETRIEVLETAEDTNGTVAYVIE